MKVLPALNIQFPISIEIASGRKTIETRTYSIPEHYIGKELAVVETPGKAGKFKSRIIGIIKFSHCFQYPSKKKFYEDSELHRVTPDSIWAWKDKPKWGWVIQSFVPIEEKIVKQKTGIVFTKELRF